MVLHCLVHCLDFWTLFKRELVYIILIINPVRNIKMFTILPSHFTLTDTLSSEETSPFATSLSHSLLVLLSLAPPSGSKFLSPIASSLHFELSDQLEESSSSKSSAICLLVMFTHCTRLIIIICDFSKII